MAQVLQLCVDIGVIFVIISPRLGRRQVVRHGVLIPAFPGSNPGVPANPKSPAKTNMLILELKPAKQRRR